MKETHKWIKDWKESMIKLIFMKIRSKQEQYSKNIIQSKSSKTPLITSNKRCPTNRQKMKKAIRKLITTNRPNIQTITKQPTNRTSKFIQYKKTPIKFRL